MAGAAAERERLLREHVPLRARGIRVGRMGLPLSLTAGRRGPFWASFLVEINFDVVLGRASGAQASLRSGARSGAPACGAADSLRAEVEALAGLGAGAVFIPLEPDSPARADASGVVDACPFLQTGEHLARAGGVRVVRPVQFDALPERVAVEGLVRALAPWRIDPRAVRRALGVARAAEARFRRAARAHGKRLVSSSGEDGREDGRADAPGTPDGEGLSRTVTLESLVGAASIGGFEAARAAFFMALGSGEGRFGRNLREVLDALGHDDVPGVPLDPSEGQAEPMPGFAVARPIWHGMLALGGADAVALHVRPRARDAKDAEGALAESREELLRRLRKGLDPLRALARAAGRFRSVALDPGALPVKIALTGERAFGPESSSGPDVVRLIEEAGGEVVAPPFHEWIYHVNRCVWLLARASGKALAARVLRATRWLLEGGERRVRRVLRRSGAPEQPELNEIWRASREAGLVPWLGEASMALGRAVSMRRRGALGVVNLVPRGRPPGTTAEAVFASRREALGGIPVLHLSPAGDREETARELRALVDSAREYCPPPEPRGPRSRARRPRYGMYWFWARD